MAALMENRKGIADQLRAGAYADAGAGAGHALAGQCDAGQRRRWRRSARATACC